MSDIVESANDIPEAWGYVLCDDGFMSGWGPAEGKVNTCIFPVASSWEADVVRQNCLWREEMKRVRFRQTKPVLHEKVLYSLFENDGVSLFYKIDGFHPANHNDDPAASRRSREAYEKDNL